MSQWSGEGKDEVYVSCLRCHKTIRGAQAYSLWAHVGSKRCYPESAIRGWRQQAKEKEQAAKIQEAHRATAEEAARKMQLARDKGMVPQQYPVHPPPQRPAEVVHLKGDEELEEISTFGTRKPKEKHRAETAGDRERKEVRARVAKVKEDRARKEEKPREDQSLRLNLMMRLE